MKKCTTCGVEKHYSEFYVKKGVRDGRNGRCKACYNVDQASYRRRNLERTKAMSVVKYAIQTGKLAKPINCSRCLNGGGRTTVIEAHIEDYSKPLEVVWLCRKCHLVARIELQRGPVEHKTKEYEDEEIRSNRYDELDELEGCYR